MPGEAIQQEDQNALERLWNEEKGCYEEGSGIFEDDGQQYRFRGVVFKPYEDRDRRGDVYAARSRFLTQIGVNLEDPPDGIFPILGGFGETSAMFEGDFVRRLLTSLKEKGYKNPLVLGINTCGKGMEHYKFNDQDVSNVTQQDELDDVTAITRYLHGNGYFRDGSVPVCFIGHSLGAQNMVRMAAEVVECDKLKEEGEPVGSIRLGTRRKIDLIGLMSAPDVPFGYAGLNFYRRVVHGRLFEVLGQAVRKARGKPPGAIYQTEAAFMDYMLSPDSLDFELFKRGVADSSARFMDVVLNGSWKLDEDLQVLVKNKVSFHLVSAKNDRLLKSNMTMRWHKHLRKKGVNVDVPTVLKHFNHAINFRMNNDQVVEMDAFLDKAIPAV